MKPTAGDQVQDIFTKLAKLRPEDFGLNRFVMDDPPKLLHADPKPPDDWRYLLSGFACGLSCFFGAAAIALFLVNINAL